jgi:drug/metabolite transporter (DMT)-like permease
MNPAPRPLLGVALTLAAATAYGLTPIFARLAYDAGATTLAIIGTRYWVAVAAMALLARLRAAPVALPREQRVWGFVVGVLLTFIAYGYLGSVYWIPVGVAALVLYTYPIIVTVGARFVLGARPTAAKWLAIVAAFAGVAIVLGVPTVPPDPRGLALAALAGVSYATMVLVAGRLGGRVDSLRLTFDGSVWAGLFCSVAALATGDAHLPATALGWVGFVGTILCFTSGLVAFFAGLPHVGPIRSSGLMNLEPVISVVVAIALLGETLTPLQAVGALLILASLVPLSR